MKYFVFVSARDLTKAEADQFSKIDGVVVPYDHKTGLCSYIYIREDIAQTQGDLISKQVKVYNTKAVVSEKDLNKHTKTVVEDNRPTVGSFVKIDGFHDTPFKVEQIKEERLVSSLTIKGVTYELDTPCSSASIHPDPFKFQYKEKVDSPSDKVVSVDCGYLAKVCPTTQEVIKLFIRLKTLYFNHQLVMVGNPTPETQLAIDIFALAVMPTIPHSEVLFSDRGYLCEKISTILYMDEEKIAPFETPEDPNVASTVRAMVYASKVGLISTAVNADSIYRFIKASTHQEFRERFGPILPKLREIFSIYGGTEPFIQPDTNTQKSYDKLRSISVFWAVENFDFYKSLVRG